MKFRRALLSAICAVSVSLLPVAASAASESVLYAFTGYLDGGFPFGGLVKIGNAFYGTTNVGGSGVAGDSGTPGVIFQLSPPPSGGSVWTETVIHDFTSVSDGLYPIGNLIADGNGALYGTASANGGNATGNGGTGGIVFKLTPPNGKGGAWAESILYSFKGGKKDGAFPTAGVIMDSHGALYGTTMYGGKGYGTVFKLTPPVVAGGLWTETVLHIFTGSGVNDNYFGGLTIDASGNLYGTVPVGGIGYGVAYEISPPKSAKQNWAYKVLHNFTGYGAGSDGAVSQSGLILDSSGALYGSNVQGGPNNRGVVFKLTPPQKGKTATWGISVLTSFGLENAEAPVGSLTLDGAGAIYGAAYQGGPASPSCPNGGSCGLIFKLAPPPAGSATGQWSYDPLYYFQGGQDGIYPNGGLFVDVDGAVYGTTGNGGGSSLNCPGSGFVSCGTVFKIVQ